MPRAAGLLQATTLGGSDIEEAFALAIAPTTGDVYVTGVADSADFPGTAGGAQSVHGGGRDDGFIARLNADLTALDQATFLGGGGRDAAVAIRLTTSDVFVAGFTESTNFPGTVGGAQSALGGNGDAFVARLSADLSVSCQGCQQCSGAPISEAQYTPALLMLTCLLSWAWMQLARRRRLPRA